ncbi:SDR family oxidoreductase [Aquisalimonas sp.]|uniref:SDR family oxidoreductase n=1 Tax=Aquisalimonas sp. TaxID=1872621 RepID=UPI0025B7C1FF|nr:SDR family oxidoreductase [Aquisalimonas sp.]
MILVTGASGTIGSELLRELVRKGEPVRAAVHVRPLDVDGVETCNIDYDRPETLPPALEGVDSLFLLSQQVTHEKPMVDAAREAGVRRIVYVSSFGADRDTFIVGQLHREIELRIQETGMVWTFLRPNYLMQNFITLMGHDIRNEDAFYDSIGDARVSRIDTRDVSHVAARVLTESGHDNRAYELSGPEAITHHHAAEMLSEVLGRRIRYVELDDDSFRRRLIAQGVPEDFAGFVEDVNRRNRNGETHDDTVTDNVRNILGREPTPFLRFCQDHAPTFGGR